MHNNLTVCLFCWNEAARIVRAISCLRVSHSEILVVDNFSTDQTSVIAASNGCKVIKIKNPGFIETPSVMDVVFAAVKTEYVLIAFAGEYIPPKLLMRYEEIARNDSYDVAYAFRVPVTAGHVMYLAGLPTTKMSGELRFFKKGQVSFEGNQVHGRGKPVCSPDRIAYLMNDSDSHFYMFRDYDWNQTEDAHLRYSSVLAKQKFEAGERFTFFKMTKISLKAFLNTYIRFGAWKHGGLGLIHSYAKLQMEIGIWIRIWELENKFTREDVIKRNAEFRDRIESLHSGGASS